MTVRNDGILRTETDKDTNRSFFPFWICLLFHGWSSFLCIAKSVCLFSVHLFLWRQQNQLLEFSVNGIVICCSIAFSLTRLVWWQSSYRALNAIAENGSTRPFLSHAPQAHIYTVFFFPSSSLHWRQTVMIMMTIGFYEVDIALLLCCTKCNVCYAHRHRIRCRCTECKRWWSENGATGMCAYAFHSNTTHHITLCIQWWSVCVRKICIIYDFMTLWMMFADHYGAVRFHVLALFSGEFLHHFDAFDCGCFCACQLRCSLVARTLATPATAQKRLSRAKAGSHKIVLANARFARPSCPWCPVSP